VGCTYVGNATVTQNDFYAYIAQILNISSSRFYVINYSGISSHGCYLQSSESKRSINYETLFIILDGSGDSGAFRSVQLYNLSLTSQEVFNAYGMSLVVITLNPVSGTTGAAPTDVHSDPATKSSSIIPIIGGIVGGLIGNAVSGLPIIFLQSSLLSQ
jgi:hypothetical protein